MFVAKISGSGTRQFVTYFHQTAPDPFSRGYLIWPADVAFDTTGAIIVAGQALPGLPNSTGLPGGGNATLPPPFVARFSANGSSLLFTRYLESSPRPRASAGMAVTPTNQIYIAGFYSGFDFTAPPGSPYTNSNFVMVLDDKGALVREFTWFEGENPPLLTAVSFASDFKAMWAAGSVAGSAGFSTDPIPGVMVNPDKENAWLARVNLQTGARESFALFGAPDHTSAKHVAAGPGGTVFLAGNTNVSGLGAVALTSGVVRTATSSPDGYLTKFDAVSCDVSLVANSWAAPASGGPRTVVITAPGYAWYAQTPDAWIKLTSPASGSEMQR
jgi:hypothetical protein